MERPESYIGNHPEPEVESPPDDGAKWVALARDAYKTSDDFFSASLRKQIEKNISVFHSKHPAGSKYHSEEYKYRSKIFRPKTRSALRRHEATAASAYFSTADAVNCTAENQNDPLAVQGANIGRDWLNYRLEHSIPWFLTCLGAYQDAMTVGVAISRQEWEYREEMVMGFDGQFTMTTIDKPVITLIPVENLRIDPAASWVDPIKSSPYLIELMPMNVQDVMVKMEKGEWNLLTPEQIRSGNQTGRYDTTRKTREDKRQDSKDQTGGPSEYEIVWVHRNIVKVENIDFLFYTLGTEHLLSEPVPLLSVCKHGRNYVMGYCNLEAHKSYPAGVGEMGEGLQQAANDLENQRFDNVKLALNRRHLVRRGSVIDFRALTNSVPGGVVQVDDIHKDIKSETFPDVTGSSYQEQDRINVDFDELAGVFSAGSVATNRALGETVGGMTIATTDANAVGEYQLRIFTETWAEQVLRQLLDMGRYYESNRDLLTLVGGGLPPEQVIELLQKPMSVRVAVGFGATNPQKRIEKLSLGLQTVGAFAPQLLQKINVEEVLTEVFGALGYRDGKRFFSIDDEQDPAITALQQQVQELTQMLQTKQAEIEGRIKVEQIRQDGANEREMAKHELAVQLADMKGQLEFMMKQAGYDMDWEKLQTHRQVEGTKIMQAQDEMALKLSPANPTNEGI